MMKLITCIFMLIIACVAFCEGRSCKSPGVNSKVYSTTSPHLSSSTVFVIQLTLDCEGGKPMNVPLFSYVDDKQRPVAKSVDGDYYQISWSSEGDVPTNTFVAKFYDEDAYAAKRNWRRDSDSEIVQPTFTISLDHQGNEEGLPIKAEKIALVAAFLLFYIAYKERKDVMS